MAAPVADPRDPGRAAPPAVGFVGLGQMGAPMAGHLVGWPGGLLVCDARAVRRITPPIERWAGLVVPVGPPGAGTRAKLARTLVQYVAHAAAGEARRLAEAAGIDLSALAEVVRKSDARLGGPAAVMLRDTAAPLSRADEW
jgi:3-hydroxyisobutyrate dehydrogenase-like beta-hydroxyacid dehydrogenase